ncbi:MAG: asparagine synthase (glutamine-hydrolyzing) [Chloroflexota bacterium]
MCGITGIWNKAGEPVEERLVARMNRQQLHRGPDDQGVYVAAGIGLGNCRLAIIDLSPAGHQPMSNEDGSIWIAFNGEIYNFQTLRTELERRGHRLVSRTDTEVIIHLYEEYGEEFLRHLRGMFALAIWDSRRQQLLLARDRLGKKPLHYFYNGQRLVFASEIEALLADPLVPRRVRVEAIPAYLTYGYAPTPDTLFADIQRLPPGHRLMVGPTGLSIRPYADSDVARPQPAPPGYGEADYIQEIRRLFREAVALRMITDVPLGAFLSGGLDSTAVVAVMSELSSQPVKTFAIGFSDEPSFNELEYARLAAQRYGADHHEFVVRAEALDLVPRLVRHYGEPFADSSAIPTYLVSHFTRQHVTVALSGDGGDELFAGYERFAAARLIQIYRRVPTWARRLVSLALDRLPESTAYRDLVRRGRRFTYGAEQSVLAGYLSWVSIFNEELRRSVLNHTLSSGRVPDYGDCWDGVMGDDLARLLYLNIQTYLPDDLLVKADRTSMANSLEVRSPFLDQELVRFAATIPSQLKLKGMATKYILKRALADWVPSEILHRSKHGFGVPVGRWFRTSWRDYMQETLLSKRARQRGYFSEPGLRRLIDQHLAGQRDFGHALWTLLTLELWHQIFIDEDN